MIFSALQAVDELASGHEVPEHTAKKQAAEALAARRWQAAQTGKSGVVTANEPGFEASFAEDLRNKRVPVGTAQPSDSWDWHGRCVRLHPNIASL